MTGPVRLNADGTDQDDWDHHWDQIGGASLRNPANQYRHKMVLQLLGVEHSAEGVRRGNQVAQAEGLAVCFLRCDLLQPVAPEDGQPPATHAVCSEVLEHVDDPTTLMRNSISLLAPGATVVVTVPGGPRSAFDRYIGHYRHFTAPLLDQVLRDAGLEVDRVLRTRSGEAAQSRMENLASAVFRQAFRLNRDDTRFGWQLAAVARVPSASTPES